jgi:predicted amidophosphoribosyltransferase
MDRAAGPIDCVVPAPFSINRKTQPVVCFAQKLAQSLDLSFNDALLKKGKTSMQMKNIDSWEERRSVLSKTVQVKKDSVKNRTILLVDDIIESGSTLRRSIEVLLNDGNARAVFALVLTRTR